MSYIFSCNVPGTYVGCVSMRNDGMYTLRLPSDLLVEIEKERVRRSREAGVEIKASALIRSALERTFKRRRAPRSASNAAAR